jgi:beta-glucanase (GH16 family)
VYDNSVTSMNSYMGGPYQQAISGLTNLNNNWYTAGGKQFQTYSFDYKPGADGKVTWYVGENPTWTVDGRSMGPNGNIGQRTVAQEPMSIVANFGISNSFAHLNMTGLAALMPATMKFDYIRIYQPADEVLVTCDPPGYETTGYIAKHPEPYSNPNITRW